MKDVCDFSEKNKLYSHKSLKCYLNLKDKLLKNVGVDFITKIEKDTKLKSFLT